MALESSNGDFEELDDGFEDKATCKVNVG